MRKSQYLVIMPALCLASAAQAQPGINSGIVLNRPILRPIETLTVREAPPVRFNPRQELGLSKVKPNFKLSESLKRFAAAQNLVNDYANELESRVKNKSVGYAFVVRYRDSNITAERAGGSARRAPDSNPAAMTVDSRLNIASVSKTITAAALLKLMAKKNLSVDVKAHTLLPPDWSFGPNFKTVSVRELLTHYSGVRFPGEVTYANLKAGVAGGVKMADKPVYQYNNSNFGLMRIMIARLANPALSPIESAAPEVYGNTYMWAVKNEVFTPAGLGNENILCKPASDITPLVYQYPSPNIAGTNFGDMSTTNASRGWNMSAKQLSTFAGKLFFSDSILSQQQVDTMITDDLGVYSSQLTPAVVEFGHNGYYPGKDEKGNVFNAGELNSVLVGFSNGISVALLVNSQFGPGLSPTSTVKQAMKTVVEKS
jgi:CubicO group peptidase (beta-lactamase class C family)